MKANTTSRSETFFTIRRTLNDRGTLFYIKASLPPRQEKSAVNKNSLPDDVWQYSEKHQTFPHQSTADQWFDELQFESYRALGQHIGRAAAAAIGPEIEATLSSPM